MHETVYHAIYYIYVYQFLIERTACRRKRSLISMPTLNIVMRTKTKQNRINHISIHTYNRFHLTMKNPFGINTPSCMAMIGHFTTIKLV
jgi:hypothetical protein